MYTHISPDATVGASRSCWSQGCWPGTPPGLGSAGVTIPPDQAAACDAEKCDEALWIDEVRPDEAFP